MRKIGINLYARKGLTLAEYIDYIKNLGFDSVFAMQRPTPVLVEAAELLAKAGMCFETVHAPFREANDIWLEGEAGDRWLEVLLGGVDACTVVGAPISVVHLSSGQKPPCINELGRARLTKLVDYAASKNVSIAFENTRKIGMLGWALEEFEEAENVGFCLDTGHEACFTPGKELLPVFGDRLICTHIHDNNMLQDQHYIPFEGQIDFERVMSQIKKCGYEGSLMLEVMGTKPIYDDITDEEYLDRAAKAIKRLRDMIDGPIA